MSDHCHIANGDCKAPAGYSNGNGWAPGETKTRAKCCICGEHVCTAEWCSRKMTIPKEYRFEGRTQGRVCYNCEVDMTTEIKADTSTAYRRRTKL